MAVAEAPNVTDRRFRTRAARASTHHSRADEMTTDTHCDDTDAITGRRVGRSAGLLSAR